MEYTLGRLRAGLYSDGAGMVTNSGVVAGVLGAW